MSLRTLISRPAPWLVLSGALVILPGCRLGAENPSPDALETVEQQVCAVYDRAHDSVVKVHARRELAIGDLALTPMHRIGTGFFISGRGRLLTAATVVRDADTCWVEWQEREWPARVVGRCSRANLAVLELDVETETPELVLGDSAQLRVGSMVLAVGYPFGMPSVPVMGLVNGIEIRCGPKVFATSQVRAGCRLRPGMAGSPLLNPRGEVVAMAVAAHLEAECFALPSAAIKRLCADIVAHGQPQYSWVGLEVTERRPARLSSASKPVSVVVREVFTNTPAAAAGFRQGDRVVQIHNHPVHSLADILDPMFLHRSGDEVDFTVLRDNREVRLSLVVGTRPSAAEPRPAFDNPPRPVSPAMVPVAADR